MRRPAGDPQRESGLTLLEVLLVMALLGLFIAAVYGFFFTGIQSWQKGVARMDHQQSARIAVDVMVRELRFADWVSLIPPNGEEGNEGVEGEGEEIYFSFKDDEQIYLFELNGDVLQFTHVGITANPVAQGIAGLHFTIDGQRNVYISVTAGDEERQVTMQSSVRPKNW